MVNTGKSIVEEKSYSFALEIILVYKMLSAEKREFILSKQLLRSGTSIGANIKEALAGESKRDFIHKMHISLKETRETFYWLNLLKDSEYLSMEKFTSLGSKCDELNRLLSRIIVTTKDRYFPSKP